MKIEWLSEAKWEFHDLVLFYKMKVGAPYAKRFSEKILGAVDNLKAFPEMGVLRKETLMGKYGFRALFIDHFACIYKTEGDTVFIYHIVDARTDYIFHIFGVEK